jgi:hypothetical protein
MNRFGATVMTALMCGLLLALRAQAQAYETPPDEPASMHLPALEQRDADFEVLDPVRADGLMYHYALKSRFGTFTAYGEAALRKREQELHALARAERITDVQVFVRAVEQHLQAQAKTVSTVVTHPTAIVTSVPRGIAHLFTGYAAQAHELTTQTGAIKGVHLEGDVRRGALRYADRFLGLTASERHWYEQLHVDPYTDNAVLRRTVQHLARVEAGTQLALKYAPLPGIPYEGYVDRALQAIYHEDPAVLRARRRATLASYGLTPGEIEQFNNAILLNPTRQEQIEQAAHQLDGVAGRGELFRHAVGVTTDEEIETFLQSLQLLVTLQPQHPIVRILSGIRMPSGETADGHIVVYGAFDAVYWTADVDGYERAAHALLPAQAPLEVWLSGSVSPRAQQELVARGWEVHPHAVTAEVHAGR